MKAKVSTRHCQLFSKFVSYSQNPFFALFEPFWSNWQPCFCDMGKDFESSIDAEIPRMHEVLEDLFQAKSYLCLLNWIVILGLTACVSPGDKKIERKVEEVNVYHEISSRGGPGNV